MRRVTPMLIDAARALYRLRYVARARGLRRRTIERLPPVFVAGARPDAQPAALTLPPLRCALRGERITPGRRYRFLTPALGAVEGARIVPESGYLLSREGRIVCPPHFHTRFLADVLDPRAIFEAARRPTGVELASAFYLLGPWHRNYYHWLIDYCPLLQTFEAYRQAFPGQPEPTLLLPRGLPAAYRELLALLWSGEPRFAWCGEIMEIGRLLVPTPHKGISWPRVIEGAPPSPASVQWLQSRILPHLRGGTPRRLLISRSRAPSRRLANEEALFAALAPLGFEKVFLEDHPFLAQADLFHRAEAVVGCHGAGLANLVFSRPGSRVIEIYPPGPARVDYHSIARVLGLDYHGVRATEAGRDGEDGALVVDPQGVSRLAARLLEGVPIPRGAAGG